MLRRVDFWIRSTFGGVMFAGLLAASFAIAIFW